MKITINETKVELYQFVLDVEEVTLGRSVREVTFTPDLKCFEPIDFDIKAPFSLRSRIEQILQSLKLDYEEFDRFCEASHFDSMLSWDEFRHRISYYDESNEIILSYTQKEFYQAHAHYPDGFVTGQSMGKYCIINLLNEHPVTFTDEVPRRNLFSFFSSRQKLLQKHQIILKLVSAGKYTIGTDNGYAMVWHDPVRCVTLSHDYYIGICPITEFQWNILMNVKIPSLKGYSYDDIRGNLAGHSWPWTNSVDPGSFIDRLRQQTGITNLVC